MDLDGAYATNLQQPITSWNLMTFQSHDLQRRNLVGLGGTCQNWLDCDGNLICCTNDKRCKFDCTENHLNAQKALNEECQEHFQCIGDALCCSIQGSTFKLCQQSSAGQCLNDLVDKRTFDGNDATFVQPQNNQQSQFNNQFNQQNNNQNAGNQNGGNQNGGSQSGGSQSSGGQSGGGQSSGGQSSGSLSGGNQIRGSSSGTITTGSNQGSLQNRDQGFISEYVSNKADAISQKVSEKIDETGLSDTAIAMIVLASVIFFLLLVSLCCYLCIGRKKQPKQHMSVADESTLVDQENGEIAFGYAQQQQINTIALRNEDQTVSTVELHDTQKKENDVELQEIEDELDDQKTVDKVSEKTKSTSMKSAPDKSPNGQKNGNKNKGKK